jgi:Mg2+ and Co2+ transporter CorA
MASVLPKGWSVPEKISARFGAQAGKQRAMVHEGHLVLITHEVPTPGDVERVPAFFWRAPDGTWKASKKGGLSALRELVDSYTSRVNAIETQVEHAKGASEYFDALTAVAPLLRAARHLHKALQEARDAIPLDRDIITLRDAAADAERTAEILQTDAKSGLDYTTARRAEETAETSDRIARSSYRLNLIAAMFLPISALGSIFGVNLKHGLESVDSPFLFWGFVVAAFVIGFIVRAAVREPVDERASR